jgi:tRNA nucleotidyltransferase (CCA-adding enzyme)
MKVFNVKPGPLIGKVKDEIKEAILEGDISNSYEDAYDYMMKLKEKYSAG